MKLLLNWLANCVIINLAGAEEYAITYTKLHVLVLTFSIQDNAKLLQQSKSGFKRRIISNKFQ